jgi:hypothetical protein
VSDQLHGAAALVAGWGILLHKIQENMQHNYIT